MSQNKIIKTGPTTRGEARKQTNERLPPNKKNRTGPLLQRETEKQTKEKLPEKEQSKLSRARQAIEKEKEQKDKARSMINKLLSNMKENVQPQEEEI